MQVVTSSVLRKEMNHIMDMIQERHEPTIVTRKNGNMVIMSLDDYNALQETAYILASPKNAQRVLSSLVELREGKGKARKLIED